MDAIRGLMGEDPDFSSLWEILKERGAAWHGFGHDHGHRFPHCDIGDAGGGPVVPELASLLLLGTGFVGLMGVRRRLKR